MVEGSLKRIVCFLLLLFPLMSQASLYYNDDDADLFKALESKRAGFIGMRGKKEDNGFLMGDQRNEDYEGLSDIDVEEKRGGFVGMRGKKVLEDNPIYGHPQFMSLSPYYYSSSYEKRRPEFLGMRGKKSGFVGMRGKKKGTSLEDDWKNSQRNVRGFVGMRG